MTLAQDDRLEDCRMVGGASPLELQSLWQQVRGRIRGDDHVQWYAAATNLRVMATDRELIAFSVREMREGASFRWSLEWSDITALKSGRDFFDDFVTVFSGTLGVKYRINLGARSPKTALLRGLIEEAADIHLRQSAMAGGRRTVVYIHGIGGPEPMAHWVRPLASGLSGSGFEPIDPTEDALIAIDYGDLLKGGPWQLGTHRSTWSRPTDLEYAESQTTHHAERARIERATNAHVGAPKGTVVGSPGLAGAVANVVAGPYLNSPGLRRAIRQRVLDSWPETDHTVVIGYSLGSVVAADALLYLPEGRTVSLVTVGSPLALPAFQTELGQLRSAFPYDRIRHWINCYDPRDEVTVGRGIAAAFPDVLDLEVDAHADHDVAEYLRNAATCAAVGEMLALQTVRA